MLHDVVSRYKLSYPPSQFKLFLLAFGRRYCTDSSLLQSKKLVLSHLNMAKITELLEAKAHQLKRSLEEHRGDSSIPAMLKREICLTVEQIDRLRQSHEKQMLKLLELECDVDSELMQIEQRTPRYSPYRFPEREKVQRRLLTIESARRQLETRLQEKEHSLEDRLLSLINKHEQLTLDNEDR